MMVKAMTKLMVTNAIDPVLGRGSIGPGEVAGRVAVVPVFEVSVVFVLLILVLLVFAVALVVFVLLVLVLLVFAVELVALVLLVLF